MTDSELRPARTRVAPSPTGDPHVGTAYMALFDKAWAKKTGGQFVLRIEDTDRARYVEDSEQQIYNTLHWLGLDPDESPDQGGPYAPYRQSERLTTYQPFVDQLIADGHAYYCWCTPERLAHMREVQQKSKQPTGYDRLCYGKTREERAQLPGFQETPVVRMRIPDDAPIEFDDLINGRTKAPRPDDQVILKADGFPTYHMAVVVDDHLMGITHIVRGQEWISSTPKHILLYQWLGWELPVFAHMPLLRDTDRSKISKRKNPAARLTWFQEQGYLPEALLNFLMLIGYPPADDEHEIQSFEDFVANFEWSKVNPNGPIFDMKKLDWMNGHYVRQLSVEELAARLIEYMQTYQGVELDERGEAMVTAATPIIQERMNTLSEAAPMLAFLFVSDADLSIDDDARAQVLDPKFKADPKQVLDASTAVLEALGEWNHDAIEGALRATLVEGLQLKPRFAFTPLRVGLTGQRVSPPLFESMALLGKESTLARLRRFRATL